MANMAKSQTAAKVPAGTTTVPVASSLFIPAGTTTVPVPSSLFVPATEIKLDPKKRLGNPPLIKPEIIPIGSSLAGKIVAVLDSMTTTVKGKLLHLECNGGREVSLPVTGTIRQALAPGRDNEDGDKLVSELKKYVGKRIIVVRNPDGETSKYGGKKKMYAFDVYIE